MMIIMIIVTIIIMIIMTFMIIILITVIIIMYTSLRLLRLPWASSLLLDKVLSPSAHLADT